MSSEYGNQQYALHSELGLLTRVYGILPTRDVSSLNCPALVDMIQLLLNSSLQR